MGETTQAGSPDTRDETTQGGGHGEVADAFLKGSLRHAPGPYFGSYGGHELISAPWDSVIVGAVALAMYFWGVASGERYMTHGNPEQTEELRREYDENERDLREREQVRA